MAATMKNRTKEKRIRLSLDLTPKQYARLSALENEVGSSKAEIVRNALRLYEYMAERSFAGETFRSFDKDGRATNVVFVELT